MAEVFRILMSVLPENVKEDEEVEHKLWNVLAPFYVMQFINDSRFVTTDLTLKIDKLSKLIKISLRYFQRKSLFSSNNIEN